MNASNEKKNDQRIHPYKGERDSSEYKTLIQDDKTEVDFEIDTQSLYF